MAILKIRLSGVVTVEASFVMGIILLIILYMITFTLDLFSKTKEFGEAALQEIKENDAATESMRLTAIALRLAGKE